MYISLYRTITTRQAMYLYVQRTTVTRSPSFYTSSVNATAWYYFSRRGGLYSDLLLPSTINTHGGLHLKYPILTKLELFRSQQKSRIEKSRNFVPRRADTCRRTDRQRERNTDGHDDAKRCFSRLCRRAQNCLKLICMQIMLMRHFNLSN